MSAVIHASGLSKRYGAKAALDGVNLDIQPGRIVGLIGPNGAGKTTALKAMLGLTPFEGTLEVMGRDPFRQRHELMHDVCFIADVAVLPRWIQVGQWPRFIHVLTAPTAKGCWPRPRSACVSACASYPRAWWCSCIWRL